MQALPFQPDVVCVLREPVSRTISAIGHALREPGFSSIYNEIRGKTIQEVIRNPSAMENFRNNQAKVLCASASVGLIKSYVERRQRMGMPVIDINEITTTIEEEPTLGHAISRLEKIRYLGVTERISVLLAELRRLRFFHVPKSLEVRNDAADRSLHKISLDGEDVSLIREYNDIDLKLYSHACTLVSEMESNSLYVDLDGDNSVPCDIKHGDYHIDFQAPIPGTGWYPAETGSNYRWTGPGRTASINLPTNPGTSYQLSLEFVPVRRQDRNDFTIIVNGVDMQAKLYTKEDRFQTEIAIPGRLIEKSHSVLIELSVKSCFSPIELGIGPDVRKLGIAVTKFTLLSTS